MPRFHHRNGERIQFTAEEELVRDTEEQVWADGEADRKLDRIRKIRLHKLKETDHLALSDTTLTQAMADYRQRMRDIPQNNTTEEQYDLILAKVDGNLKNEIWSKP